MVQDWEAESMYGHLAKDLTQAFAIVPDERKRWSPLLVRLRDRMAITAEGGINYSHGVKLDIVR